MTKEAKELGHMPVTAEMWEGQSTPYLQTGITRREYFSIMALQGILSNSNSDYVNIQSPQIAVNTAAGIADMLLEELAKTQP